MRLKEFNTSVLSFWGELLLPPCLLLMMFGWPFVQGSQITEQVFEGVFLLLILIAAMASSTRRLSLIPVLAFGVLAFALDTVSGDANPSLERLATVFDLLFSLTLSLNLLVKIFGFEDDVSWLLVANALSVYLLIGLAFAAIYNLAGLGDAPLGIDLGFNEGDPDLAAFATTFFSFVTQTSLGYGDITPENARIHKHIDERIPRPGLGAGPATGLAPYAQFCGGRIWNCCEKTVIREFSVRLTA